jgi:D-lactate dehydrogenase
VIICNRREKPEVAEKYQAEFVSLEELYRQSDIITLHVPLVPETRYIVNAESVAVMKPGVMIINTGRGGLIDTRALIEGLKTGQVGYAGLDVYEEESAYFFEDYSEDILTDDVLARLTTFNNVIITSHQAFLTQDALANIAEATVENINEYRSGKKGCTLVNAVAPA